MSKFSILLTSMMCVMISTQAQINTVAELPAHIQEKINQPMSSEQLNGKEQTSGYKEVLGATGGTKNVKYWRTYKWDIKVNHESGTAIGMVTTKEKSFFNLINTEVTEKRVNLVVKYCCDTNPSLCVPRSERDKHPECTSWNMVGFY